MKSVRSKYFVVLLGKTEVINMDCDLCVTAKRIMERQVLPIAYAVRPAIFAVKKRRRNNTTGMC